MADGRKTVLTLHETSLPLRTVADTSLLLVNHARAIRVAEIMTDFRNLQHYVAQVRASPEPEEYYLEGFAVLRHCAAEAQAVLSAPFSATPSPDGDPEQEKAQLRSVILDASIRRFRCQKVYLRATAAMRWVNSRQSVLRGQKPHAGHMPALQAVDNSLRAVSLLAKYRSSSPEYTRRYRRHQC